MEPHEQLLEFGWQIMYACWDEDVAENKHEDHVGSVERLRRAAAQSWISSRASEESSRRVSEAE